MILAEEQGYGSARRARLRAVALPGDVIALSARSGLARRHWREACSTALGHEGEVPSPSFAIVQPYDELDPPVWHVDLFRIDDVGELDELGLEAAADGVLIVEWPEKAGGRALGPKPLNSPWNLRRATRGA